MWVEDQLVGLLSCISCLSCHRQRLPRHWIASQGCGGGYVGWFSGWEYWGWCSVLVWQVCSSFTPVLSLLTSVVFGSVYLNADAKLRCELPAIDPFPVDFWMNLSWHRIFDCGMVDLYFKILCIVRLRQGWAQWEDLARQWLLRHCIPGHGSAHSSQNGHQRSADEERWVSAEPTIIASGCSEQYCLSSVAVVSCVIHDHA